MVSPDLEASQNVVSTATPQAAIVTIAQQPSAHSHRHLWALFVDSFKPPGGSKLEGDSEGAASVQVNGAESGNVEKGFGSGARAEVVPDGDVTDEPDRLKRNLDGRHLQVRISLS